MKSLREYRTELLGLRLSATGMSLWNMQVAVAEAGRAALNDAIRAYEFTVPRTYNSLVLPESGVEEVALPRDALRVVGIELQEDQRTVTSYTVRPTEATFLVQVRTGGYGAGAAARIRYEARLSEFPEDVILVGALTTTATLFNVTGGVPRAQFRAPGVLEITPAVTNSAVREVVFYNSLTYTGFAGVVRNWGGMQTMPLAWTSGARISAMLEAPEEAVPVIQAAAQANMYHYWLRHRAWYDQYTGIASEQQLDVGDLLGMIRTEEDRADRLYKRIRKPPEPTTTERKSPRS